MRRFQFVCVQMLLLAILAGQAAAAESVYTVAVVPQSPAPTIQREWSPLLARVEQETGLHLELKFYQSIPEFERGMVAGEPDFVYMNPYHAVMARKAQNYIPLLREGKQDLVGILVVKKESRWQGVHQLDGQVVAFPSPNALAASLYMRALLAEKEKIKIIPSYVKTHGNVYRHVLLGKAAAGGGVNKTLKKEPASLQGALRILYQTPGLAPHPLCVHPRIPEDVAARLVAAIMGFANDADGKAKLAAIAIPNPVRADYQRDYASLAELGLENYQGNE